MAEKKKSSGKKAPQYYLFDGNYSTFNPGEKARGLHLNKMVRDVLRACGYPCLHCFEPDCFEACQEESTIGMLLKRIEMLEKRVAELTP